ncbi:MAG: glycine--tRNA ligase subunit beta, partial [Enterococcus thailandicus]|nr:glycine--tRNA ligase subunit beta [Enterococcus thailandicus]
EHLNDADFKPSMESLTRVINLAKKAETTEFVVVDPALFENEAESALNEAVNELKANFATQTLGESYESLVQLRPLIEEYFDQTMVMAEDQAVRANRLTQLKEIAFMALSLASLDKIMTK